MYLRFYLYLGAHHEKWWLTMKNAELPAHRMLKAVYNEQCSHLYRHDDALQPIACSQQPAAAASN